MWLPSGCKFVWPFFFSRGGKYLLFSFWSSTSVCWISLPFCLSISGLSSWPFLVLIFITVLVFYISEKGYKIPNKRQTEKIHSATQNYPNKYFNMKL